MKEDGTSFITFIVVFPKELCVAGWPTHFSVQQRADNPGSFLDDFHVNHYHYCTQVVVTQQRTQWMNEPSTSLEYFFMKIFMHVCKLVSSI